VSTAHGLLSGTKTTKITKTTNKLFSIPYFVSFVFLVVFVPER